MVELRIFSLKGFLNAVDECTGPVYVLGTDGQKDNINKNAAAQKKLTEKFLAGGKYLLLSLDIPRPKDYFNIITYYISNL